MPAEVSTWGAKTTAGFVSRMAATTSSTGAGANGAVLPGPVRRAFITRGSGAMPLISRICVQR